MPGLYLPDRQDEMDAYREWLVRQDEDSAAAQAPASPSPRLEASPVSAADSDKLLAEFAALVLAVAAARQVF